MKFKKLKNFFRFFGKSTPRRHSEKKKKGAESAPETEEFERCVICGELTCIPVSMPVDWRENYELGFGQICAKCARKHRETEK